MRTRPPANPATSTSNGSPRAKITGNGDRRPAINSATLLLCIDGGIEAVLGAVVIGIAATGPSSALDLPDPPASKTALVVFGLLFLALCPILWRLSRTPRPRLMLDLAIANGASALVFALWVLIWNQSFHPASAILVLVTAGILATLSVLEARTALATA
ncbi:MAG: hypothetical protein ACLQUY_05770 [Ktedonobacterales bacterium]